MNKSETQTQSGRKIGVGNSTQVDPLGCEKVEENETKEKDENDEEGEKNNCNGKEDENDNVGFTLVRNKKSVAPPKQSKKNKGAPVRTR